MNRKKSKVWRKELNALRGMSDMPWPARRFRIAPTLGQPLITGRRCRNIVGERYRRRRGWRGLADFVLRRRPIRELAVCSQPLQLVAFDGRRHGHLICPRCTPIRRAMRKKVGDGGLRRAIRAAQRLPR